MTWECVRCDASDPFDPPARNSEGEPLCLDCEPIMATNACFKQDRKDWAAAADHLADRCYTDYFGITDSDIYDVESLVDDVHDRDEGYRTHQILDYGGIDRILDLADRHVYVAQRFRPTDKHHCDLSLRTNTGIDGRHPELTKWLQAYETRGFYPSLIAFGLWEDVLQVFSDFYLLDTERLLDALTTDTVTGEEHQNDDGTAAMYLSIEDLEAIDAVLASWDGVTGDTFSG